MGNLVRRIGLLEKSYNPPILHTIRLDYDLADPQCDVDKAKRKAVERYQLETGITCQQGDQRIFLVDFTGLSYEKIY
jgi:hypothetical protein